MEKPYLKVKLLNDRAFLPSKRDEDASFDLYAIHEQDFNILYPGDIQLMKTGIAIEIPKDWVFYIVERSSTGSKGIAKRCGVIDSGYRGEIFIPINNTANKPIVFAKCADEKLDYFLGEKGLKKDSVVIYPTEKAIAQGMLLYSPHIEPEEVDDLNMESERGDKCLGSTKK